MGNILITGMSAPQYSPKSNARTASFASQLDKTLTGAGHVVTWTHPKIDWDGRYFDAYDAILIGMSPVLSVTANHGYGALKAIQSLFYDPRLTLFIDAPNPAQITASLNAVSADYTRLCKDFFAARDGFEWANQPPGERVLIEVIKLLRTQTWPPTLYPSMPWADWTDPEWFQWMPFGFGESAVAVNLDGLMMSPPNNQPTPRSHLWAVDDLKSPWAARIAANVTYNFVPLKPKRFAKDSDVSAVLAKCTGTLLVPQKDGITWWTPRLIQSLIVGTPVVTEWRDSKLLGPEWAVLASTVEDLDDTQRILLAEHQLIAYLAAIPFGTRAVTDLEQRLKLAV